MEPKPWPLHKEEALLEQKISSLGLKIEGTAVQFFIKKLYNELEQKGLIYQPLCFLGDEWFCPYDIPAVGIPFYLIHRKLRSLENKFILEVEGGSKEEFIKLLRHEAGHAYALAYRLNKKRKWQQLFGSPSVEYPETYRPRPHSRAFVLHLENWYAQSHPEEDFAETFAVWLTPNSNWKTRYRGWKGAMEKIEYLDTLMKSLAGKPPLYQPRFREREHSGLNIKLSTYFKRKRKAFEEDYPDFYDQDLKTLFTSEPGERSQLKAHRFLKKSETRILNAVSYWTSEKKYTISQLLKKLTERCRALNLSVREDIQDLDLQIASFITALISNYLFTGKFKRPKHKHE